MEIPLLNIEDIEKEEVGGEEDIRRYLIDVMKRKGFRHLPATDELSEEEETSDLFTDGVQLIEIIIDDDIPEDVLEQLQAEEESSTGKE